MQIKLVFFWLLIREGNRILKSCLVYGISLVYNEGSVSHKEHVMEKEILTYFCNSLQDL